jgi:signal transduction histidine kinase/ligand-binding sensor domain-containing protein
MERFPRHATHAFFVLLLVLVSAQFLQSHAEQLPVKTYTIADGLARDYINRIRMDSHGFIWFCTAEGVSRFDGYSFTNYGVNDGLPHRIVNDFLETRDGLYLFATYGGLVQFDPMQVSTSGSHFTIIPFDHRPDSQYTVRLLEDPDGSVWCGTTIGLYRLTMTAQGWQADFIDRDPASGELIPAINTMTFDGESNLWLGTPDSGVYCRRRTGRLEHYTTNNGLSQNGISDLLWDHNGRMWVGTGIGLTLLKPDPQPGEQIADRVYRGADGLLGEFIECLFESSDRRIWVGTRSGLHVLVDPNRNGGKSFVGYSTANGLRNLKLQAITEDRDHNLWIGAEGGGAMKIPLVGFTSYFETDGLGNGRISQIFTDRDQNLHFLCNPPQPGPPVIMRFDGHGFIREKPNLPSKAQMTWGWNQLITQDREGDWWIPMENGIYQFTGNKTFAELATAKPKLYTVKAGKVVDGIFRLFEDTHGDIWFGTLINNSSALHRWERSTDRIFEYNPADKNIPAAGPTAFANDSQGNLWIGFYNGGIARYRDGHFTLFTESDGVPSGFVRHLFFDSRQRLWIATSYGGVARADNPLDDRPAFVTLTTKDGLSSNQVTSVIEDRWGRIYLGTGRGIDRYDPQTGKLKHFTTADGLADNFINVSFADAAGALWFGTLRGLSRFVPEPDKPAGAPSILINSVKIAGVRQNVSELGQANVTVPDLSYTQNDLQIDFLSLSYAAGDFIRYQYRFAGSNSDWSAPAEQRTLSFPNLLPGTYRFMVRAVNSDGAVSAQPATITFRILPPLWKRWWVLTLAAATAIVLLYLFYRYRLARLREVNEALAEAKRAEEDLGRAREERLVELARVRTRIATDLHDDIGASLTQIAILSEVAQKNIDGHNGLTGPLKSISSVSNELVETMSDIVWAINPKKDHLQDLIQRMRRFASDLFPAKGIIFEFNAPTYAPEIPLGANARREVFLIFKESLTNIARHATAAHVTIDFEIVQDHLWLTIKDDGCGFDPEKTGRALFAAEKGGHGIFSMKRRAAEMRADFEIASAPGQGTTTTFRLPLYPATRATSQSSK